MKKVIYLIQVCITLGALVLSLAIPEAAMAGSVFHTDPPPSVYYPGPGVAILYKELGGYPNYGVEDGLADVLYSTEDDIWTFDLSSLGIEEEILSAKVRLSLVLDDHYARPENEYVGSIVLNGSEVFLGKFSNLGIVHGAPYGKVFTNWVQVEFEIIDLMPSVYTVYIQNETTGQVYGDWIAMDAIELELTTRMPIQIDIKPGSDFNSINPWSRGVIPVALLASDSFDATAVNLATVRFGGAGSGAAPMRAALEDINGDGKRDLVLHFKTQDTGIACGDGSAWLTGETFAGKLFQGGDTIKTTGCK